MSRENSEGLQSLSDYIDEHYQGNQSAFGRSQGVQRAQVNQWLKAGYVVSGDKLLAVRRELTSSSSPLLI